MKKSIISILILLMYVSVSFAQNELNVYKYVIIPKKYSFLKGEDDKYKLNSLTKFLFTKKGFHTLFEGENYPKDLLGNQCLAVKADVLNNSSMLSTKLIIELKDCYGKVVYQTIQGKSKQKDYEKAYQDALRKTFASIESLNYKFDSELITNRQITTQNFENKNIEEPKPVSEAQLNSINDETISKPDSEIQPKSVDKEVKTEVANVSKAIPVVVPVVVATQPKVEKKTDKKFIVKSYKNNKISFFLIEQNNNLVAYVNESKDNAYQKGEMIGTLIKTSIPNVYRVTWKNKKGENKETTGYFDVAGNLKIDVNQNGKIEVIIFEVEK